MNYLAHIHIAHYTDTSKIGAFLGDFVKGSLVAVAERSLKQGIALHREIDRFVDSHAEVSSLLPIFPSSLRRAAPIALDLAFDHFLAKNFDSFCAVELNTFTHGFYQELLAHQHPSNSRLERIKHPMSQDDWLYHYHDKNFMLKVSSGISRRISQDIGLVEATEFALDENHELETRFFNLYPQVLVHAQRWVVDFND